MDQTGKTVLYISVALLVVTATYVVWRYYRHEKWYHDLFLAIHAYNCAKIADSEPSAVIEYTVLLDCPDFFASKNIYKNYIRSAELERVLPYLPKGGLCRWIR